MVDACSYLAYYDYMSQRIQAYITDEQYDKLTRLIEHSNSDMSKMIRAIIKTYLSKRPNHD